jgi:hypothetical protein
MGNALESVGAAQAAGFVNPDGSLADPDTVAAQWQAVHDGPPNSSTGAGYLTTIRLPDAAINVLVDQTVAANEVALRQYFPGWDNFPADGQIAIQSKAYAMGTGVFPATFPNFVAAVNGGDWTGAIAAGAYHGVGTQNRQAQEAVALANAAAVAAGQGDPATLYWPGSVTGEDSWGAKLVIGSVALLVGGGAALAHFRPVLAARALATVKGWWQS